jgi:hypothetical protein
MNSIEASRSDDQMYAAGPERSNSAIPSGPATIRVSADADADVLVRIAAQLSYLNTAPTRLWLERRGERVEVVVDFDTCTLRAVDLVCRKLAQLTSVLEVSMTSEPRAPTCTCPNA